MENLKNKFSKKRGFTLVELLVVIAIIAILSVTAYVALGGQTGKARNSRRQQDLGAIQSALEIYFVENYSKYPADVSALVPDYMPELPVDPIPGSDYVYAVQTPARKLYQLATTLEQEDGTYEAYVIGNSDTPLIPNGFGADCNSSPGCNVEDGDTDCLPYCP